MNSKRNLASAVAQVAVGVLALSGVHQAMASDLYWDTTSATAGAGVGGTASGTWDGSVSNWTTSAAGSTATTAWIDNSRAIFSAGSDATGVSSVLIQGGFNVAGLVVEEGSIVATGGPLTLTDPNVSVASGASFTIGADGISSLSVSGSGIVKTGGGVFTVGSNFSSLGSSLTVNEGTFQVGNLNAFLSGDTNVPQTVSVAAGATFNFRDNGDAAFTFTSSPNGMPVNGPINYNGQITGAGNVGFIDTGSNLPPYKLLNSSSYTGETNIVRSLLWLSAGGKLTGTSAINVALASEFFIDDTNGHDTDRVSDSATVNLKGGIMQMSGSQNENSTETIGNLNLGVGGQNYLTLEAGNRSTAAFGTTLTIAKLTRDEGGALLIRGNVIGTNNATNVNGTNLKITDTTGLLVGGTGTSRAIIPGVYVENAAAGAQVSYGVTQASATAAAGLVGTNATLATYDANGVRPLTASEYSATLAAGVNLAPTAAVSVASSTHINALEFGGASNATAVAGQTITIAAGQTLSIDSGTILSNSTSASTITGSSNAVLNAGSDGASPLFIHNTTALNLGSATAGSLVVNASSLTKDGQGQLVLGAGVTVNNTGGTYINQGSLLVNANNQLGDHVVVGSNGVTLNNAVVGQPGGSLQLAGGVSYDIPLTLSGAYDASTAVGNLGALYSASGNNTWSGDITLTGPGVNSGDRLQTFIGVASGSTLTLSGSISADTGDIGNIRTGLVFGNAGTTVLTGSSPNVFGGLSRQYNGTVIIEKDMALGIANQTAVDDNFIQFGSGTNVVAFRGQNGGDLNYTTEEWIFTNQGADPYGTTMLGVISSIGGNNTFAGHIAFGNAGSTSTTVGPGGFNRIAVTTGSLNLTGSMWQQGTTGDARVIEKYGTGELILSADNSGNNLPTNSFATQFTGGSAFLVTQGALRLRGAGNVPSQFQNIVINRTGSLIWDDSLGALSNRNQNAEIDINGGEFQYVGNGSTLSPSNVKIGGNAIVSATGAAGTVLDISGADRTAISGRGTLLLRGVTNTTNAKVKLANNLSGSGATSGTQQSIIPWAIGDASITGSGTDFVTLDSSGYARPLTASEYASGITSGTSTLNNTNVSAPAAISADTQVNSIKLSGAGSVAISAGTLTVNSGAIFNASGAPASITGGNLSFNNEAVLTTPVGGDMTISSAITNANGLTKAGDGNLTLSGASSFGGQVTINGGTLFAANDAALGSSGNQVNLAGGNLTYSGASTFNTSRNYNLNSFGSRFWLMSPGAVNFGDNTVTATGHFNGVGALSINVGSGSLTLTGNSIDSGQGTFTFNVGANGSLTVNDSVNLNTSAYITINQGANSTGVYNGDFNGQASGVFVIGAGANATFNGHFWNGSVLAMNVSGNAVVTPSGGFNHPGSLVKNNTGTLTLQGENDYTTTTSVNAGTLIFNAANSIGITNTSAMTVASGATAIYRPSVDGETLIKPITDNGTMQFDIASGLTIYYDNNAASTTTQIISGSGRVIKSGAGTLIIGNQGSQNSYSGGTLITGGVLEYVANDNGTTTNGLPANAAVAAGYWQISNNATLRFNEGSAGAASFGNVNRSISVGAGGGTVEVTALTGSQINNGLLGSTTLTKKGPGAFVLNSNNTSFSGKIAVAEGLLGLNNDNNLGAAGTSVVADKLSLADATTLQATAAVTLGANRGITLTSGVPTITTTGNNSLTINGPISGSAAAAVNFTPGGTGVITLNGANTYTAITNLTTGKLVFGSSFTTSSSLTVADNALAQLASGGKTLAFGTLNLNSSGKLDLTNGRLVLTGTTTPTLRGLLASGYSAGAWTGVGIDSSTAAADANHLTAIGYLTAGDLGVTSWGAATGLTSSALVTLSTYYGDINLDTTVSRDDLALLDRGNARYASGAIAAGQATWLDGDANYDGIINANDYLLTDISYVASGNPLSPGFLAQREAQFGSDYVSQLTAAVPEPASLGIIGLVGAASLARRRRTGRQS